MSQDLPSPDVAQEMADRQRDISVAEFFLKNRHLLGFDSPSKALLTSVKEAVDNALDACEEAGILPEVWVAVTRLGKGTFQVAVRDNGPGIVDKQLSRIFGKLLYGSKFHKLSQSRGQQGMGISAAGMYAQLTTGRPLHVVSRVRGEAQATELFLSIDTAKNRPELHKKRRIDWEHAHGTLVQTEMEGHYLRGPHSIDMYLKQTAIANPHVQIHFRNPHDDEITYQRISTLLPPAPLEIKPHPRGVELGHLIQMLQHTRSRTLRHFLEHEFSRVGRKTSIAIIQQAGAKLSQRSWPKRIAHAQANALHRAIRSVAVSAPRTDCLVPIGQQRLHDGLLKETAAEFCVVVTRPPAVYRGNPFQIEIGVAYGAGSSPGKVSEDRRQHQQSDDALALLPTASESIRLLRFANRVPLLYDHSGCVITKAVAQTNWRAYGLQQSKGALPMAPMALLVHIASVWVPFTSEAKEAIASYAEISRELKLGLQQAGRLLAAHLRRERRLRSERARRSRIEKYLPHIGSALQQILDFSDAEREQTVARLDNVLDKSRETP